MLKNIEYNVRELKKLADLADDWLGIPDRDKLKITRQFIDRVEMLTDLCIFNPNRVVDIEQKKKPN
jgi:hypothetical protein